MNYQRFIKLPVIVNGRTILEGGAVVDAISGYKPITSMEALLMIQAAEFQIERLRVMVESVNAAIAEAVKVEEELEANETLLRRD